MTEILPADLKDFLDEKYSQYASSRFIETDPIQIPRSFSKKEDIEISGLLTATIAWGQRPQIIKSATKLMQLMGNSPYEFITQAPLKDITSLSSFYYRTFNGIDCVAFLKSLQYIYTHQQTLESVFAQGFIETQTVKGAISYFRSAFTQSNFPHRSLKHISNPMAGSAAKRLNMYLRWMVRPQKENVDFGLWKSIPPSALMLPLDVHSSRVARKLGLLTRKQTDWRAVEEVTNNLCIFDPHDPVKYDFALFGLGVFEKF